MKVIAMIFLTALVGATSTNALAGCGWILWFERNQTIGETTYRPEWEVAGSTDTFEKCQEQQEQTLAAHLQRLISDKNPEFKPFLGKDSQIYSRTLKDGSEVVMRIG